MREGIAFFRAAVGAVFRGGGAYTRWMAFLLVVMAVGGAAWAYQLQHGLDVTSLSDHVPWGVYIANFTYLIGLAAAAVMLVIPAYVYHDEAMHDVVLLAEILAVAVLVMCLLFVTVDVGRPDRLWHMVPGVGRFNFPVSMLAWDVVVVAGYLAINLYVVTYLLYTKFAGRAPRRALYWPVVALGMGWAIGIHTVTAFLYCSVGGRPAWHSAVMAPRFLASAFASGPALMIVVLTLVRDLMGFPLKDAVLARLRQVVAVAMLINLFFLGTEVFTELYPATLPSASTRNLLVGLHGHWLFVPYIWSSIVLNVLGTAALVVPRLHRRPRVLLAGCCAVVVGVWIGKGMGLIIPGFVPSPLGEIVEYSPSMVEFLVSMGIWAAGAALLTLLLKVAVPIEMGTLRHAHRGGSVRSP